jgi:hypothetical protein
MTEIHEEKTKGTKPKEAGGYSQLGNTLSMNRMANKQRKKRAHKRNLRKSNANG